MVLLIIIPMKNGYFIGKINPTFSDKPKYSYYNVTIVEHRLDMEMMDMMDMMEMMDMDINGMGKSYKIIEVNGDQNGIIWDHLHSPTWDDPTVFRLDESTSRKSCMK